MGKNDPVLGLYGEDVRNDTAHKESYFAGNIRSKFETVSPNTKTDLGARNKEPKSISYRLLYYQPIYTN